MYYLYCRLKGGHKGLISSPLADDILNCLDFSMFSIFKNKNGFKSALYKVAFADGCICFRIYFSSGRNVISKEDVQKTYSLVHSDF